tara:strand:+ start:1493 stop:1708 length:216 start_codon:yes stop_codon:yes gene_type:complete
MATIEFNNESMKRFAENLADFIAVVAIVSWTDILLGFNIIPGVVTSLVAWPTLIGATWLGWKFVRGHQWFK